MFLCCKYLKFDMDQNLIQQNSHQRDCLVSCTSQPTRCQFPLINHLEFTIVVVFSWHHDKRASKIPSLGGGSEPWIVLKSPVLFKAQQVAVIAAFSQHEDELFVNWTVTAPFVLWSVNYKQFLMKMVERCLDILISL